jgi:hypothetical protein
MIFNGWTFLVTNKWDEIKFTCGTNVAIDRADSCHLEEQFESSLDRARCAMESDRSYRVKSYTDAPAALHQAEFHTSQC